MHLKNALIAVAAAFVVVSAASSRAGTEQETREVQPARNILFMCPHGAAKSVLASAYFQRLARERGLNVRVTTAGTEPDAQIAPAVASHLAGQGYDVPATAPRQVTAEDLALADLVISLGCDLSGLPKPRGTVRAWDDIPSPSANFTAADEAIRARVIALIDELARQASPGKP
jgi:arsenate reductase (thioredoxin)